MRRTKIVATVGPASRSPEMLQKLLEAGVDVFRLNFTHGTHDEHLQVIQAARQIAARLEGRLALLQDLSGPKIRTGLIKGGEVLLVAGARVAITTDTSVEGTADLIATTYAALPRDVTPGEQILLDDGNLELRVLEVQGERVLCETSPSASRPASTTWRCRSSAAPPTCWRRSSSSARWGKTRR